MWPLKAALMTHIASPEAVGPWKYSMVSYPFRNLEKYPSVSIRKINVFYGMNAQGKTSLIGSNIPIVQQVKFQNPEDRWNDKVYTLMSSSPSISYSDYTATIRLSRFKNIPEQKEFFFNKKRISQTDFM